VYLLSECTVVFRRVGVIIFSTVGVIVQSSHIRRWRKYAAVYLPLAELVRIRAHLAHIVHRGQLIRLDPLDT